MKNFKIVMMKGDDIRIDESEIPKILQGIATNQPVIVKQGIFNPSSYVSISRDRTGDRRQTNEDGHYTGRIEGEPLVNIFEGIEALAQLKSVNKQLN